MSKQLNIDMRFNADVSAAKAQLQSLQTSINQLTTSMATQGTQLGITPQLQQAQQAAVQLKTALSQSMNVETGKFDLSKFNSSLKSMNTDLSKLKTQLVNLGPSGQQTFMTLAQSIMTAEIPTKRISASLAALGTTIKNTAKWQLSSSMLHGFMSAVQTSYRYAQDLNQSLNNIRIVTGESAEAMDKFAVRANKAAKALSASTLDYTNAALIYYQQGLQGKEVEERANITIKMANVSRQSAEVVSDQLTAVWNNFYDGSQSLESFADKMVALGAATASSSDEIAGGLEKFAAVGEAIGLSFDYAAAALATITSNTRQSEEVVGTALKTIFARMESLKLGETLEDGTSLNKYTESLKTVGVDIFDANNQLKDMDQILDETAAKWKVLSRDQQVALANSVAGIRQYNQFIALMDNWDDGTNDSMKANLETAASATGALQEQADIYAESWEAANKRVKASAEALYTSILDDNFFIDLSNGLADLLDRVKVFVEALGGVKGILLGLSGILLNTFSGAAAQGLENMVYNFRSFIGLAQKDALNMKNQVAGMMTNFGTGMQLTNQQQGSLAGAQQQVQLQNEINQLSSKWTDQQKAQAQNIVEINRLYGEQVALLGEAADKANQQKQSSKNVMLEQSLGTTEEFRQSLTNINKDVDFSSNLIEQANKLEQEFAEGKIEAEKFRTEMEKLSKQANRQGMGDLSSDLHRGASATKKTVSNEEVREDNRSKRNIYARRDISRKRGYNENNSSRNRGMRGVGNEEIEDYVRNAQDAKGASDKFAQGQETLKQATEEAKQKLQELNNTSRSWSQTAVGVAQGMSSIGFGIQSLSSMFKTLTDDSASFGDKLLSAFTGLGMALPMLINGFNGLKTSIMGSNTVKILSVALGKKEIDTLNSLQLAKLTGMGIEEADAALKAILMKDKIIEIALSKELNEEEKKKQIMQITGLSLEKTEALLESEDIARDLQQILIGEISLKQLAKKTWATITYTAAVIKKAVAEAIAKAVAGDYSGVIILVTAGLIAGTAALIGYAAAQEAENQKIAEGNEQLDKATEAYEKAAERAKQFKEIITGYEDAVDSLKDLVVGTDEYTEALKKANAEAAKMIDMYPDMEYTIENGLIKIASADYQEYYNKLKNQQQMFDTMRIQATANLKKAENEKNFKTIKKDVGKEFGITNYSTTSATYGGKTYTNQGVNYKDEFIKNLQNKSYADQKSLLSDKAALKEVFSQIKIDTGGDFGSDIEFDKWADKIVNASESEKDAILANINALKDNTAALRAEIEANQQQKYGERFVAEHGAAEIYGAETEIAKTKMETIDWNTNKKGNQSSYADYLDDIMNQKNNASELSDKDKALVAKIFGVDESTMDDREIRFGNDLGQWWGNGGQVRLSEGKDADSEKDLKLSYEDFNARAAIIDNKLTITEAEVDAFLNDGEKRKQAAQTALDSGLYSERDMIISDANSSYDLMTVGQKEDFSKRFESDNIASETETNIENYLKNVDSSIKQKVADRLLQMSDEELNAMDDEAFKKLTKEETDAFYSRDIGRVAQDQANQYGLDANTLTDVAKGFRELGEEGDKAYKNIKDNSEALVDAARVYMRMNGAIVDLRENSADYTKTLNNIQQASSPMDKAMAKNSESAKKLRKTLSNLLDTQEDMVDSDLLEAIDPKDLEKAAKGDIAAINRIRDAFIDLQVKGIEGIDAEKFKQELNALEEGADINLDGEATIGLEEYISQLALAEMMAGASEVEIESKLSGMGISCDAVQFYDTLAEAQAAAAETGGIIVDNLSFDTTQTTGEVDMTQNNVETDVVETVKTSTQSLDSSIPYQAGASEQPAAVPVKGHISYFTKTAKTNSRVVPTTTSTTGVAQNVTNGAGKSGGKGKVAVIQGPKKKSGNTYNPNYNHNSGNTSGSNGGGGKSSKPVKTDQKKKNEEVERYHEINQELEDLQNNLDDIANLKDEAWGADKLALMDKEKKKLQEITNAHKKYQAEIAKNLNDDRWEAETKYGAKIDPETKRITNYEELQEQWKNEWNTKSAALDVRENAAGDNEDEKAKIEEERKTLDEEYEAKRKAIEQYEETLNLSEEAKRQLDDYLRQMRQLNYEKLEYKIEMRTELNENDIADIEFQLERLGEDNIYNSAERIALIEKNAASYKAIADAQIEGMREAERLYAAGEISQTDYLARLQESKEALQDAERSIREGIQQISEELQNTFDLIDEKLDQQYNEFDKLTELMEHYKNVVSLTEGEASYTKFNELLRAQQQIVRDRVAAEQDEVAMWTASREQLEKEVLSMPENSVERLAAEEALDAIIEKEAEAKSQLMADIEQLGEYAQEIFENAIEQAKIDFEEAMFGGSLSSVIESIEMLNASQEEVLTTTNKIYETNKLIRNIEKDIDATTNSRAKQAYLEFQNKVKQKQEQNELTQFELDLLTAEYEMTKAQIALEEAQNAKDTVRLTRDAEGNYGYVYTANEDKVADAEQALDDATNNYYNTALEGAQKYQDQIYKHIEEWEEKIAETVADQTLSEEEKNKKIAEINKIYDEMIRRDKELYYIAIDGIRDSSYNKQVDYDLKGIESAEKWFTESDKFITDLKLAQEDYDTATGEVKQHTEDNFGKMSDAISNTKTKSTELKEHMQDDLIPFMENELDNAIGNSVLAWDAYVKKLEEVIKLTDEAMQKNAQAKELGQIEDFSAEIGNQLGKDEIDWDYVKALVKEREAKIARGEFDDTDFQYINAMAALEEGSPMWLAYAILRNKKIARLGLSETPTDLSKYNVPKGFATGGYTGSWGPEGRLAVLHEKELVLNKQDTENFLSATNILREISQMLDRDALIASLGAINLRAMTLNSPADQILQQEVTIHADFPNVTDHNEIEIAIDNLINAASQHAYKS